MGHVHCANGWRDVLGTVLARHGWRDLRRFFRADAAFAIPAILARVSPVPAVITNSREAESLGDLVKDLGSNITAGTTAKTAAADVVFVAIRWEYAQKVLGDLSASPTD